jgi:beta-lactamase regulating signal transducer with metallopeptidase domain
MNGSGWFLVSWILLTPPAAVPSLTPPAPSVPATVAAEAASTPTASTATAAVPQTTPTAPAPAPTPEAHGLPMPIGLPPRPTDPGPARARIGSMVEPALWLVGALVLGALGIAWLKRMQQVRPPKPEEELHAQLASFREAHLAGEMTKEEFEKVKAKLAPKIKELEAKPPAAPPPKGGAAS